MIVLRKGCNAESFELAPPIADSCEGCRLKYRVCTTKVEALELAVAIWVMVAQLCGVSDTQPCMYMFVWVKYVVLQEGCLTKTAVLGGSGYFSEQG